MFKVNNKGTRRHWRHSSVFIGNFEDILNIFLVFLLHFEQVNAFWVLFHTLYTIHYFKW